jgi:hypothetical protein
MTAMRNLVPTESLDNASGEDDDTDDVDDTEAADEFEDVVSDENDGGAYSDRPVQFRCRDGSDTESNDCFRLIGCGGLRAELS